MVVATMSEAYEEVVGGSLRLKGVAATGGVKKKKKKKKAKEVMEALEKVEVKERKKVHSHTPAEKAFIKVQEKRQAEKILQKAEKTHKQRVEELNTYLDSLTEHYDIPKVSWTK